MADIKRLNYFNSQFLVDKDFGDEQDYHLGARRQHNLRLHGWGVVDGFAVSYPGTGTALSVGAGLAIDSLGREILLAAPVSIDPKMALASTIWVTVAYQEAPAGDAVKLGPDTHYTRTLESAVVSWSTDPMPPAGGNVLVLARVVFQATSNKPSGEFTIDAEPFRALAGHAPQPSSSLTVRNLRVSGVVDTPPPDDGSYQHAPLRVSGRVVIDPNEQLSGADGSGALSLFSPQRDAGFHFTCVPFNYSRALSISCGQAPFANPDVVTITQDGNIGINNPTPDYVRGSHGGGTALRVNAAIVAENSDLYFTNPSHHHTGAGNMPGCAAIENSAADEYNALMILGRNVSNGPGETGLHRVVKLWDELTVFGQLKVGTWEFGANLVVYGDIYYKGRLINATPETARF